MTFSDFQKKEICATITSLYFLSKESLKNELQEISVILLRAVKEIDDYVVTNKHSTMDILTDDEIFDIIEFFEEMIEKEDDHSIH